VIVGGDVGFNVSKTDLNFGIVPRNAVGHRSISLFSPEKVKVNIAVKGNIKNLLVPSENNFVLLGNKTLMFNLKTLGDTVYGNYSGKVILTFRDTYT
jgi:hypothetical protein